MLEQAQVVTPFERLVSIKALPLFRDLPGSDLVIVAERATEERFSAGEVLLQPGRPVPAIHALVSGEVEIERSGRVVRAARAGDAVGLYGLLARSDEGVRAVARGNVVSLAVGSDVLFALMEDKFAIFDHVIRATSELLSSERRRLANFGIAAPSPSPSLFPLAPLALRPLHLLERILFLQKTIPFAGSSPDGLSLLAQQVEEVRYEAGATLWREGDIRSEMIFLVSGMVSCHRDDATFRFAAGDTLGATDAMARIPYSYTAVTDGPMIGLKLHVETLLDIFEDHIELGLDCLAAIAGGVLDTFESRSADEVPVGLHPE